MKKILLIVIMSALLMISCATKDEIADLEHRIEGLERSLNWDGWVNDSLDEINKQLNQMACTHDKTKWKYFRITKYSEKDFDMMDCSEYHEICLFCDKTLRRIPYNEFIKKHCGEGTDSGVSETKQIF